LISLRDLLPQAGCFFKFLTDRHGIYDGDEFAMKSGNAELRGLKAMSALGMPELCFPLVAIVDFRGYRLLASSRLPLGTDTLKYGRYGHSTARTDAMCGSPNAFGWCLVRTLADNSTARWAGSTR
jgi:hypothetical protein